MTSETAAPADHIPETGRMVDDPAEMPTREQVEAEIIPMTYDGADLTECVERVMALFAPILAEKEREIDKLECDVAYYVDGNAVERIKHEGAVKRGLMVLEAKNEWRDRALAAEAALAADREKNAALSKQLEIALAGLQLISDMAPKAAAAIRAEGQ